MDDKTLKAILKSNLYPKLGQSEWSAFCAANGSVVSKLLRALREVHQKTLEQTKI